MGEKYGDDRFSKESQDSRRDYYRMDYHDDINKSGYDDGHTFSNSSLRQIRDDENTWKSNYDRDMSEYRDKRKEHGKIPLKGSNSRSTEHYWSSRYPFKSSSRNRSPRPRSRSPSPYFDNQRSQNMSDSSYYSTSSHATIGSTFKGSREHNSYSSSSIYRSGSSSHRHSSGNSRGYVNTFRENPSVSFQQSWAYKAPVNTHAWEMTTHVFISPVQEQEKEFLRLNEELVLLDEKSKGVFKEKRLSMFEWQKLIYKSEIEAQNVEFAEKQLEAVVNGSLFN
ncbi:hypothetical protein PCANB_001438 [Pneumocystis canis]|nr:hypothetical protein PCANB_001438 [Pneumocystis canis]